MKKILFLLLFPCLALAQYQGNANQKITLGEQTTADGLIWRGVASDTTLTVKSDTAAYLVLDTANLNLYTYKASATGRKWIQVETDSASIAYVNTYGTQTVNGAKTFTSTVTATRFNPTSSTVTGNGMYLPTTNTLGFSTNGVGRVFIKSDGNVGYGTNNPVSLLHIEKAGGTTYASGDQFRVSSGVTGNRAEFHFTDNITSDAFLSFLPSATISSRYLEITLNGSAGGLAIDGNGKVGILTVAPSQELHVVGNGRFTAVGAGTFSNNLNITSDGTLTTATSDEKFKYNIRPLNYGLSTLLQLKPVNFQWIEGEEEDLGFIAQDVAEIIPEAVNTNWNSDLLFRYESLIPILTKAIQEQNLLIKALEQRIINLENK
jgi:hypothetical protein